MSKSYRFKNFVFNSIVAAISFLACSEIFVSLKILKLHYPYEIVIIYNSTTCDISDYEDDCELTICKLALNQTIQVELKSYGCTSHNIISLDSIDFVTGLAIVITILVAFVFIAYVIIFVAQEKLKLHKTTSCFTSHGFDVGRYLIIACDFFVQLSLIVLLIVFKVMEIKSVAIPSLKPSLMVETITLAAGLTLEFISEIIILFLHEKQEPEDIPLKKEYRINTPIIKKYNQLIIH